MEKEQAKRLSASEARAQTPILTIDVIMKEIDMCSKRGESIYFIHPSKYVSADIIVELMRLQFKVYEFKDQFIGINGYAIDWK